MILIVDNYDSFAYNLVQYVGEFEEVEVRRNDEIDVAGIRELDPDGIVVSPGPETPEAAAVSVDDRGFRYGDAAFETCRGYGGTVFAWDRHRRRWSDDVAAVGTIRRARRGGVLLRPVTRRGAA